MGPGQPVAKREEVVCVARTKEKAGKQCDSQPTGPRGALNLRQQPAEEASGARKAEVSAGAVSSPPPPSFPPAVPLPLGMEVLLLTTTKSICHVRQAARPQLGATAGTATWHHTL